VEDMHDKSKRNLFAEKNETLIFGPQLKCKMEAIFSISSYTPSSLFLSRWRGDGTSDGDGWRGVVPSPLLRLPPLSLAPRRRRHLQRGKEEPLGKSPS